MKALRQAQDLTASIRHALPLRQAQGLTALVAGLLVAAAGEAQACPMCMGGADASNGPALNGAIFIMLGCLGIMFSGIGAVAYGFWRRRGQGPRVG